MRLTASLKHAPAAAAAVVLCLTVGWGQEDDLAKELPRIPAHEPADALSTRSSSTRAFSLKQAAVEPVVHSPVAVCLRRRRPALRRRDAWISVRRTGPHRRRQPAGRRRTVTEPSRSGTSSSKNSPGRPGSCPTTAVSSSPPCPTSSTPRTPTETARPISAEWCSRVLDSKNVQGLLNGLLWGNDGWIYGAAGTNGGDIVNPSQPGGQAGLGAWA